MKIEITSFQTMATLETSFKNKSENTTHIQTSTASLDWSGHMPTLPQFPSLLASVNVSNTLQ